MSKAKPVGRGILFGFLTSIPVIVINQYAQILFGAPLAPFDLFDFVTRILPGGMVTFGIDTMVRVITALRIGPTASVAKIAEQSLAMILFVVVGGVFGGVTAAFSSRDHSKPLASTGAGLGFLLGVLFILMKAFLGFLSFGAVGTTIWYALLFSAWGFVVGWLLDGMVQARIEPTGGGISRREALYLGGAAIVAVFASILGLGFLFAQPGEQEQTAGPAAMTPEPIKEIPTPAGSPSEATLAKRIDPVQGTRKEITSNADFYRVDINLSVPEVPVETWRLKVDGMVDRPMSLTMNDIYSRPAYSQYVTLQCISNRLGGDLISTNLWTGIRVKDLMQEAGLQPGIKELYVESYDGFSEAITLEDMMDDRTLLVYAMNGVPISAAHGYPLRVYVPNRFGMKQPKWVVHIEARGTADKGYWVARGWSETAIMPTTSVIDNVVIEKAADGNVHIGGIAEAGARGISKVEVQIDDGEWAPAVLRDPPLGMLTWVQWRFDGSAQTGSHVASVRAYDGTGALQIVQSRPPSPNGATGISTYPFEVQ